MKKALITWITGQDWAYLAEFLLKKGYEVHGIKRRSSLLNTDRIDHLYQDPHVDNAKLKLHYGDMTDSTCLINLVWQIEPDEIYNLAAQSHVKVSFEMPEYTANADAIWTLRLLEAIRTNWLEKKTKFYQASTSEMYGWVWFNMPPTGYTETSPFYPRSPYWAAKLYAHWITINYRESYWIFACNGILFNHESPLRWETFVTRKITRAVAQIYLWLEDCIYLGNLDAKRDRWHAKDYVEGMRKILQYTAPEDFVLATWRTETVRSFVEWSFKEIGKEILREGEKTEEIWKDKKTWQILVRIDSRYYRPSEVEVLLWDATKAREKLWWQPMHTLEQMTAEMVKSDIEIFRKQKILKEHGYDILSQYE
jgi:GDPmannose 4,6-dehydratase